MVCSSNPSLSIEKTFKLTRADKDLLLKQEHDVQVGDHLMLLERSSVLLYQNVLIYRIMIISTQAWCMLLNDKVTYRMQWPQYADLQVNGMIST